MAELSQLHRGANYTRTCVMIVAVPVEMCHQLESLELDPAFQPSFVIMETDGQTDRRTERERGR